MRVSITTLSRLMKGRHTSIMVPLELERIDLSVIRTEGSTNAQGFKESYAAQRTGGPLQEYRFCRRLLTDRSAVWRLFRTSQINFTRALHMFLPAAVMTLEPCFAVMSRCR